MPNSPHQARLRPAGTGSGHKLSPASRNENILLAATELFVERTRHGIEEKKIFLELARNFLPHTSLEDRRRIAGLIAPHPEIPHDILEQLATDTDHHTAYPVLRYSERLSVDLLANVAETGPDSLRKAIALRSDLDDSLVEILASNAGPGVLRILESKKLVPPAATEKTLAPAQDATPHRTEAPSAQADQSETDLMSQFLHLPRQLKAKALAEAETANLVRQAQGLARAEDQHTRSSRIRLRAGLVDEALAQNRSAFSNLISRGLGLPLTVSDLLLQADQADGLTIALKALGMSEAEATTVLLRLLAEGLKLEELRGYIRLYRTVSQGAANLLVSQWLLIEPVSDKAHAEHAPHYQERRQRIEIVNRNTGDRRTTFHHNGKASVAN